MEEDECLKMLDHLQQYIPHLEKLIVQLKDPKRKNRELQLNKLEGLHSMITDRKKKLKLDTLKKCEDVILKILHKVHPNVFNSKPDPSPSCNMIKFVCKDPPEERHKIPLGDSDDIFNSIRLKAARARLNEVTVTPASPSPPREMPPLHAPIVIPTEKVNKKPPNPDEFQIKNWENTFDVKSRIVSRSYPESYKTEKPDVYSKAAESLSSTSNSKKVVFDRLGTRVLDMSKPPLSAEDLQQLTAPEREVYFDDAQNLSMGELEDLRQVLQKKLQQNDDRKPITDLRNKLTRENPNKTKEKEQKAQTVVKSLPTPVPPPVISKPKSPRIEKVYKNPDSIFGNLLSSIDEQILGDSGTKKKDKKDQTKDEKHSKSDQKSSEKDSKKDSGTKKDHHSSDKKEKESKSDRKSSHKSEKKEHKEHKKDKSKSESKDKESDKHKDKSRSESKDKESDKHKDKSRSESKDKESDKHKSSKSDKHKDKDHKSKHHDKKKEDKSGKRHEESVEHKIETKSETKSEKVTTFSTTVDTQKNDSNPKDVKESSQNKDSKETPVFKRLADKYNPRPRKNSIEAPENTITDENHALKEIVKKIPMLDKLFQSNLIAKDRDVFNRTPTPSEMIGHHSIQSLSNTWHERDSQSFEPPRDKPNMLSSLLPSNNSLLPSNNRNIVPSNNPKPPLLNIIPNPKPPLLNIIPPLQGNSLMGSPFLQSPSGHSNIHLNFPPNNQVVRQNDMLPPQAQFIPPQQNIMNQNNRGGNTYLNTFILQNNVSSNMPHTQFTNPLNNAQKAFHGQISAPKVFHPYDPIDGNNEYDLSKMSPVDFYSPQYSQAKRPLLSPPNYAVRAQFPSPYPPRDPRDRSSYNMGRPKTDTWSQDPKNQWHDRNVQREREENYRASSSRDPRIRAREMKERAVREPPTPVQTQIRRTSIDENVHTAQNKYDSMYSRLDPRKSKEQFVSPLDSLYTTGNTTHRTGKGYGIQKFRIPRKKTEIEDRQRAEFEDRSRTEFEDRHRTEFEDRSRNEFEDRHRTTEFEDRSRTEFDDRSRTEFEDRHRTKFEDRSRTEYEDRARTEYEDRPRSRTEFEDRPQMKEKEIRREESDKEVSEKASTIKEDKVKEVVKLKQVEENIKPPEIVQEELKQAEEKNVASTSTSSILTDTKENDEEKGSKDKEDSKENKDSKDIVASPSEQSIIADFITNLIQSSKKQELLNAILTSLTDGISEQQKKKFKRIQKIVDSDSDEEKEEKPEKKSEASDTKVELKTEKVEHKSSEEVEPVDDPKVKTKGADEEVIKTQEKEKVAEEPDLKEEKDEKEKVDESDQQSIEVKIKSPKALAKKKGKKRGGLKKTKKGKVVKAKKAKLIVKANLKTKQAAQSIIEPEDENVVETVGERIKNRRRNIKTPETTKGRKCRTELDMLHEDIKEMFIRDGVLTATGKRMCRILKSDPEAVMQNDTNAARNLRSKLASSADEDTASSLDSPKRRARISNPKVVIEKTDFSKLVIPKPVEESESENETLEVTRSRVKTRGQNRRKSGMDTEGTTSDSSSLSPIKRGSRRSLKSRPNYMEDTDDDLPPPPPPEPEPEPEPELEEERETSKQDNMDIEEPETDVSSVQKESPPKKSGGKKKKRNKNWALGVIKKVHKKKVSSEPTTPTPSIEGDRDSISEMAESMEEPALQEDSDTELVEPDKDYYFDPQDKSECRLCSFKGKMIVQHYKTVHAKHEVQISRIAPDNAQKAIEECIEKAYEDIEVTDTWEAKNRRKRFTYQCRFCQVFFKNENAESFFDHLTGHTGEYRFICNFCNFKTANSKSLRSHMHSSHNATAEHTGAILPTYPPPPNFHMVFGYICGECNFIQMDRTTVETHVKIYHLGEDKKIYKINMSMVISKPTQIQESNDKASPEPGPCEENQNIDEKQQKENNIPEEAKKPEEVKKLDDVKKPEEVKKPEKVKKPAKIKKPEMVKKPEEVKKPEIVQKPEMIKRPEEVKKPEEPKEVQKEPVKLPAATPVVEKEIPKKPEPVREDPTVFKYNVVYTQENIKLDEQKHEKMKEINKTIIPKKKFSFDLLDKIKSRLDDKNTETAASKNDLNDFASELDSSANANLINSDKSVTAESSSSKKLSAKADLKSGAESVVEKPIINKPSVPITNIIERLQGKLQPPPLTPLNEFNLQVIEPKSEDINVQVGPVAAINKNGYILYACYMQSCMFSSTIQSEFGIHCRNFHNNKQWDGFCSICNVNTNFTEVEDAYNHLVSVHKSEFKNSSDPKNTDSNDSQSQVKSYLRMRRLSGDKLSETRAEMDLSPDRNGNNEKDSVILASDETLCKIVNVESQPDEVVEDSHSFPFHISNVTTLTPEEDQALNTPVTPATTNLNTILPTITVLSPASGSGALTTVSSASTPIAIPLPLTSSAGGYSFVLPMLTPVGKSSPTKTCPPLLVPVVKPSTPSPTIKIQSPSKVPPVKPQPKRIMLKDTPLQPQELAIPRKSGYAISHLLSEQKLMQLYKCPERHCTYSTDSKKQFESHLHQHKEYKSGMQVPCLYCNFKTDFDYIGVHYDIRHGRCQFCCVYCFYRGLNQSYVEMHQEREHSKSPRRVLMVPVNPDALMSQAHITMPAMKAVVPYYTCGQLGCESRFVFPEDFSNHLQTNHKGVPLLCFSCQYCPVSPDDAVNHMQNHNVSYYHCRYCLLGGNSMDEIYKHLSFIHFALSPIIVLRQFTSSENARKASDFACDDLQLFDHLKLITVENYNYITPNARFEVVPAISKPVSKMVKKTGTLANIAPKTGTLTNIAPKPQLSKNSTVTMYKAKKPGLFLRIVKQQPKTSNQNTNTTISEIANQDDDIEIVQVSDDETSPIKEVTSGPAVPKKLVKGVRPQSPIVLNKFLGSPKDLLSITQTIPSSTGSVVIATEEAKKAVVTAVKPVPLETKTATDFIVIQEQPEDEPVLDVVGETVEKSSNDDIDPLQLELEPCTAIEEENSEDTTTEHTFTEAKLSNFGFTEDGDGQEFADLTAEEVSFSVDDITKKQGLSGRDLFRCGFCRAGFETAQLFRGHVAKCVEVNKIGVPRPFKCCHCIKAFKSCNSLLDHVRLHGTLRFACSLCDFKHQHQLHLRSHMKTRHSITSVTIMPVDPNKRNYDEDEFVVRPKTGKMHRQKSMDGSSGNKDSNTNGASEDASVNKPSKSSYGPSEVDSLPIRPIFSQEIKCSACGYLTKVRANLVRHFQFHATGKEIPVPAIAPVNPVPCLEKNEKMFDKMTNLALSSFNDIARMAAKTEKKEKVGLTKEEEAQLPMFVPSNKRYVCGAIYCNYLCLEESMLRCHLLALHSGESLYKCTHCSEKLSPEKGVINVDYIIKHLKLHELNLYKCRYCKFVHNLKHKVDRHVLDKHPDKSPVVIVVREMEREPEEPPQEHEEIKEAKPWRCGMCKYRCITKNEIVLHVFNKHDLESQHKCALCKFRSNEKFSFSSHFETDHPGQNIDVIDAYYEVGETPTNSKNAPEGPLFDTTPLWQRDKYKLKHIRGIPVDETNKTPKKSPLKPSNSSDNLDKAIEAVASGSIQVAEKEGSSILKPKKPKTLKEKKLEISKTEEKKEEHGEIIEIEDDIADLIFLTTEKAEKAVKMFDKKETEVAPKEIRRSTSTKEVDQRSILQMRSNIQIEEEAVIISFEDIQKMDLDKIRNAELTGTYGPFGKPFNKQYLCPLCGTFKTKKAEDITHHLYKELDYPRFVCTSCGLTGITYTFLQKHSAKKHIGLPEAVHPISPDPKIEDWVQKVLAIQRRLILDNESIPTVSSTTIRGETKNKEYTVTLASPKKGNAHEVEPKRFQKSTSSDNLKLVTVEEENTPDSSSSFETESPGSKGKQIIHQCQHCSYNCKAASDMRKHEKRHWAQKPLKCGYCDVEGVTNYEVIQHSKRAHIGLEPLVIAVPTPSTPTIKPITRKRKYPKSVYEISSSSDEVPAKHLALDAAAVNNVPSISEDVEIEVDDAIVLVCSYCPKRCNNEADMKAHWELIHKSRQSLFKYKKVNRAYLPKKGNINYKCHHCEFIGNMDIMKKHFKGEHEGLTFSVFRYKCPHCHVFFRTLDKLKVHCKYSHCDTDPIAIDIEDPIDELKMQEKTKDYVCEYCDADFDTRHELVDHHKAVHSHLELNLPPDLTAQLISQQKEEDDRKMFMCPKCRHTSNSYASMRDHVRAHAKPFQCFHCTQRFIYPSYVKHHHGKEHPNLEYKYLTLKEGIEMNENLRKSLLVLQADGSYDKISFKNAKRIKSDQTAQPQKVRIMESAYDFEDSSHSNEKITARKSTTQFIKSYKPKSSSIAKVTARKSTTQLFQSLKPTAGSSTGFSYYGNKPDLDGIENLKTSISFYDSMASVSVLQLKSFFDIFPTVPVVDIAKHNTEL